MITVGRIYRFRAIHSLPDYPKPWCFPHQHDYTVEIVMPGDTDTAEVDATWEELRLEKKGDLNAVFQPSTVEHIAETLRRYFDAVSVTVWEDQQRWGRCSSS
jgi:hypothetical protein